MNVAVSLVLEMLFLSQKAKTLSRISLKYFGDACSFSLECSCQHGVKSGHIAAEWVGECCSELGTQVLFLSQTLKNVLLGCSGNAARYKWTKVAVMVWAGGGNNFRGWRGLMLWSSQH